MQQGSCEGGRGGGREREEQENDRQVLKFKGWGRKEVKTGMCWNRESAVASAGGLTRDVFMVRGSDFCFVCLIRWSDAVPNAGGTSGSGRSLGTAVPDLFSSIDDLFFF